MENSFVYLFRKLIKNPIKSFIMSEVQDTQFSTAQQLINTVNQ